MVYDWLLLFLELVGAWLSPVEHLLWEQGVVGSNPAAPTINKNKGLRFSRKPLFFEHLLMSREPLIQSTKQIPEKLLKKDVPIYELLL